MRLADYYSLRTVTDMAVSPDGRRVAFVVEGFRKKDNDRYQNLWVAPTDGSSPPHRLTRGPTNDSSPVWSPDGRYLAFLSTREHEIEVAAALAEEEEKRKRAEAGGGDGAGETGGEDAAGETSGGDGGASGDEDAGAAGNGTGGANGGANGDGGADDAGDDEEPKPQIWVFDLELGGEPRQLTRRDEGVGEFDWSPEGTHLVFSSRDPTKEQKEYLKSIRGQGKPKDDRGPHVIRRTSHKHDGTGYLDEVRTHLFVVDVRDRKERRLTSGPCDETSPRWSPDGRWIAFVSNRTGDPDNNRRNDLWLISPDGAEVRRLTLGDVDVSAPRWSPDSRRLAFVSPLEPENEYLLTHVLCVEVADAEPVADLAACVGEGWSSIGGTVPDQPEGDPVAGARRYPVPLRRTPFRVLTEGLDRPASSRPVWLGPDELLVLMGDRGQTRLARTGLSGEPGFVFPVSDRMCTLRDFDAAGGTVVLGVDRPETGVDLYALDSALLGREDVDRAVTRLTRFNEELLAERATAGQERVEFRNSEGETVEAIVVLPPGFDPAAGPAPLIVNIHGGPMSYDSPGFQFDDQYWAGLGYLVLKVNYRGSVSYGEDFCLVIRGDWGPREHDDIMSGVDELVRRGWADPDRLFCTGFSYGGIMTNWAVGHTDRFRAAASEHGLWDYVSCFGTDDCHLWWQDDLGVPWQNLERYRRMSPMSAVQRIKTPLLITAGEVDWRCPASQAEQLYLALKKRGVPTELILYQGERHAITKPKRAIDRIRRISAWFARYGGQPFEDDSAEGYPDPE